jgi:hypothetical protein
MRSGENDPPRETVDRTEVRTLQNVPLVTRRVPRESRRSSIALAMRITVAFTATCAFLGLLAGCTQIFGLEPPQHDPCEDGCPDASSDPPGSPSPAPTNTPSTDAGAPPVDRDATTPPLDTSPQPDAAIDVTAAKTFRCGATAACDLQTQQCCAIDTASGWSYSVLDPRISCPGVAIECAVQADCDGESECCTGSDQFCTPRGTCETQGGFLTCDPKLNSSECPANEVCLPYADKTIPYSYCR